MRNLLLFGMLSLVACGGSGDAKIPPHIMNQESMSKVLMESQLVEGALLKKIIKGKKRADMEHNAMIEYNGIYERHGISKATFDSSWSFYLANPTLLEPVYDSVVARLERLQAALPQPAATDKVGGKHQPK